MNPWIPGQLPRIPKRRSSQKSYSTHSGEQAFPVRLQELAVPETTSSEVLSTLSRVLGAVGCVTKQPTAVGGYNGIDEVLQLSDAG
jgi:hypothetical protein